jgi:ribosomal protein L16/L10AE
MLQPKRTKYRKVQKGRMKGNALKEEMNFQWNVWN